MTRHVFLAFLAGCQIPPSTIDAPQPVGTELDPVPLGAPIDRLEGRYPWQNLGVGSFVGHVVDAQRESFVFGSNVVSWREHDDTFYQTPGEVVVVSTDRQHVRLTYPASAWGGLVPFEGDANGDGLLDLLVTGDGHFSYLASPFSGDEQPVWRHRRLDLPAGHPLRHNQHYWPGHLTSHDTDLVGVVDGWFVGVDLQENAVVDLDGQTEQLNTGPPVLIADERWSIVQPWSEQVRLLVNLDAPAGSPERLGWDLGFRDDVYGVLARPLNEPRGTYLVVFDRNAALYALDPNDPGHDLQAYPIVELPSPRRNFVMSDLDGDGNDDLVVNDFDQSMNLRIYRGPLLGKDPQRDPDLVLDATQPGLPQRVGFQAADLDGDGADELALIYALDTPGVIHIHEDVMAPWHEANPGHR